MHIHSVSLLEQMFAILGHSKDEQKELSEKLVQTILQTSLTRLALELSPSQREEFKTLLAQGKQTDEVFTWLEKVLDKNIVEKHMTTSSYTMMQKYLQEISPSLSPEQKEKLAQLFLTSTI